MKCIHPYTLPNGTKVPCTRCKACRINKISSWTVRILGEIQKHPENAFLTLTYDEEHIHYEDCYATLRKRHIQLFHKRLRKKLQEHGKKVKYFCCGEYGETCFRPHYHAIYTGCDIKGFKDINVKDIWGKGDIYYGCVTPASIRYVLGYIMEKGEEEDYEPAEPPFQISSNLFGAEWIDENFEKLAKDGFFSFRGKKIAIPKFIRDYYGIATYTQTENEKLTDLSYKEENKGLTLEQIRRKIILKEADKAKEIELTLKKKEEIKRQRQKNYM